MNMRLLISVLAVTVLLVLSACGSSSTKSDSNTNPAAVEDRNAQHDSGTTDTEDSGAVSMGLDNEDNFAAASLDDPDSILAVRVIYFDYDSATIRGDFSDAIAAHGAYLAQNPSVSLTLEGHADERGSREYNLALGERRALAVRRQLVLLGASAGQIRTVSYGEERPAVDGHDDDSYGLNRRVEMVY